MSSSDKFMAILFAGFFGMLGSMHSLWAIAGSAAAIIAIAMAKGEK